MSEKLKNARQTLSSEREAVVSDTYRRIESNLTVLGATGIRDDIQDGVKETLSSLKEAGIKVRSRNIFWVSLRKFLCQTFLFVAFRFGCWRAINSKLQKTFPWIAVISKRISLDSFYNSRGIRILAGKYFLNTCELSNFNYCTLCKTLIVN